jgi:hypothetical protein
MTRKEHLSALRRRHRVLNSQWTELCECYLPIIVPDTIWRYSRNELGTDLTQGWKLHVAATLLSAVHVFEAVAPLLSARNVRFKAPVSLNELDELNRGTSYGYSQVGKFLTVYPQTPEEAVQLARDLHELTRRIPCPEIPFDLRYGPDSCVFYRYGAFQTLEIEDSNGKPIKFIRDPNGNPIPDKRDSVFIPEWTPDPFTSGSADTSMEQVTQLQTTFRAFRAFTQRGKGGVYHAVDLSVSPARLCVIKQGRRHGEVSWDGRDGQSRVKYEKYVLSSLKKAGLPVPLVYSSFKSRNNYYLVTEFIEGENLEQWLTRRKKRLSIAAVLKRSAEVAQLVARIHAAGWVWRDCKPSNIILTKSGELRPLDFEGACRISRPDPLPWGTPGYTPPQTQNRFGCESQLPEDLYALGVIIYLLLAGRLPDEAVSVPLEKMRKNVPQPARRLVAQLLDPKPLVRPRAHVVALRLEAALKLQPPVRFAV